ncbi:E3 ubiquitin-protein ligase TRIM7-like [Podarcis lilfordi]|uniref:E3 ubiquitin-protein ligase TRIM7-like n=1 Tax=Podarcis lilfordi TaxID=74358 RepID=A0AA35JY49_9SAUR|nr:E3 ubiquitin-protein ligase TRIM7-like [Podarcis lilfordi]
MGDGNSMKRCRCVATCPICLCYFTSPVLLNCGHSFCQTCIRRCWEQPGANARCPECRRTVERTFRPNRSLSNLAEILKDWEASAEREAREQRDSECQRHRQPWDLFCEDDQVPFCGECASSQEHRGHRVVSAEEAAQVYKEQISSCLPILRTERERLLTFKAQTEIERQQLLEHIEGEKGKAITKFSQLHQFLEEQEDLLLEKMQELEEEIARKREEHLDRLSRDLIPLETLILEMEAKLQRPTSEVLQNIRSLWQRFEEREAFETPVVFSVALHWRAWEFSDVIPFLDHVIQEFKYTLTSDLKYLQKARVTLDPVTAHPQLLLSEDCLSVTCADVCQEVPDHPQRFKQLTAVLGREGFRTGRFTWEVTVGNEGEWAVGVAKSTVKRQGAFSFTPMEGIWAMGRWGGQYRVLHDRHYHLPLNGDLRRIRVTLNCTGQRLAFFDAERGNALVGFTEASFCGELLLPFFWLQERASLTLSP